MDLLLIIGLIAWIAKSAKKRRDAQIKREAAQARARAAAFSEAETEKAAAAQVQPNIRPTVQQAAPRTTEPQQHRHPLMPSRKTGHVHMETSMTGIDPDCPPMPTATVPFEATPLADRLSAYKAKKRHTEPFAKPVSEPSEVAKLSETQDIAFRFDPVHVREGLIYAEILGKPKALRR